MIEQKMFTCNCEACRPVVQKLAAYDGDRQRDSSQTEHKKRNTRQSPLLDKLDADVITLREFTYELMLAAHALRMLEQVPHPQITMRGDMSRSDSLRVYKRMFSLSRTRHQ